MLMYVVPRQQWHHGSVKDMKGKTMSTLPRGNTTEVSASHILKVHGVAYTDMKVNFGSITDAVTQMQDGHSNPDESGPKVPVGASIGRHGECELPAVSNPPPPHPPPLPPPPPGTAKAIAENVPALSAIGKAAPRLPPPPCDQP